MSIKVIRMVLTVVDENGMRANVRVPPEGFTADLNQTLNIPRVATDAIPAQNLLWVQMNEAEKKEFGI